MGDEDQVDPDFEALLDYIKRSRGFDFTGYKRSGLHRRIVRRMQMVGVEAFSTYTDFLEVHPDEFTHLFNTILINVTGFFRDAPVWDYVAAELIPDLLRRNHDDEALRVWSAACATGEEAYTIAMLLLEAMGEEAFERRVKIFATDLDEDALQQARIASYSRAQVEGVPQTMLEKYFERQGAQYAFRKEFRRCIIFGRHDLMQDAPISRIDLLLCRNVLMYFNSEAQARVLQRLHFALREDGILLMGKAEMLFSRLNLFTPLDLKHRSFSKVPPSAFRKRLMMVSQSDAEPNIIPAPPDGTVTTGVIDKVRIREAAYLLDPMATLVFDHEGYLIVASDQARRLFGLVERDLGRAIQDLELSYRPIELRSRIEQAIGTGKMVEVKEAQWVHPGGETRFFEVQVIPLFDGEKTLIGVRVTFQDFTRFKRLQEELQQAQQELETAYEELQSTNEERETANEELQSTNEELETTNEEIQSTNEELETMNEELQSTNEELQATNEQLRDRSDELISTNAFLRSILGSMSMAVVVVDDQMRVRAWNDQAREMWGLSADEVIGQHFLSLDMGLPVEHLRQTMKTCLGGAADGEIKIPAVNRRGRHLNCRVKCVPVEISGNKVGGVILSMEEAREPAT